MRGSSAATTGTRSPILRVIGAILCVAVTVIHVLDQGGLTELKDPAYIGYGYWALEIAGIVAAVLLLIPRRAMTGWVLALGVAAGPLLGYILTRTVGLPDATDDIGNWGEPLGVASLVVEAVLLILAIRALAGARSAARTAR